MRETPTLREVSKKPCEDDWVQARVKKVHPRCRIFGFRWWRLITVFALRHLTSAVCSLFSDDGVSQIWARPHSLFSELILMCVLGSRLCWWIIVLWSTLGSLTHPAFSLGLRPFCLTSRRATKTRRHLVKQLYTAVLILHCLSELISYCYSVRPPF